MPSVHTGVVSFDRHIDFGTLVTSPDKVVTFVKRELLAVGEAIFDDGNRAVIPLLCLARSAGSQSNLEFLLTIGADEDQRLPLSILCLVKHHISVAFGASQAFHSSNVIWLSPRAATSA